eukprot:s2973_g2.t1
MQVSEPISMGGEHRRRRTTDEVVELNRKKIADARVKIFIFLESNGFDSQNLNLRKTTRQGVRHDSLIKNDVEMVVLLLWFGADPLHYDSSSRNAFDYATAEVREVFEQMNSAPHSARLCGKTKLERTADDLFYGKQSRNEGSSEASMVAETFALGAPQMSVMSVRERLEDAMAVPMGEAAKEAQYFRDVFKS